MPSVDQDVGKASEKSQSVRDIPKAGPRTDIGSKRLRVGDLVLVATDDGREKLAQIAGAYRLSGTWTIQLKQPPGVPEGRNWLPQSVRYRAVRKAWGPRR